MNTKLNILMLLFLGVALVFSGCTDNSISGNIVANEDIIVENEVIEVGGIFHLTGPGAFWGETEKNAALLAVEDINSKGGIDGAKLDLIIEDSKTEPNGVVSSMSKLKNVNGVEVIVGPTWHSQIAAPLSLEYEVAMVSPSGGVVPVGSSYFFDVWPTEEQEVEVLVEYFVSEGIDEIVLLYSLQDWSNSMHDKFVEMAEERGIEIVKEIKFSAFEDDFSSILLELSDVDADAVYGIFAFYPSQGAFSKEYKLQGVDLDFYSSSGTENPVLLEAYPEISGTVYPYPKMNSKESEFVLRYVEKYGKYPGPSASYAYDSVMIVGEALKSGARSSEEISAFLSKVEYEGISNDISFDSNGRVREKDFIMKVVGSSGFVEIED